jgi:hypothetical protein
MEGTKQNPLWPPPFDHAFESTDSSVATQRPEQTNVTLNKKIPGHTSPFLLNLYNYTSISDYLLDLSKKDLLQKQLPQHSQQHTKIDPASLNYKSPVSYVAVVIPNQSKNEHVENSDPSIPPEPSFVGVVYPQGLSSEDAKQAVSFTSAKSKNVKDNKTLKFKPLTKSLISDLSQKVHHNDNYEIQDPPLETHYNSLYHGSSSALESTASSNISDQSHIGNIQKYPNPDFSSFFHDPEIHSKSNTQLQGVNSAPDSRTPNNFQKPHIHDYLGTYYSSLPRNIEIITKTNSSREGTSLVLNSRLPSNSSGERHNQIQSGKIDHYPEVYYSTFQNVETQPRGFSFPHSPYNNYHDYQDDRSHNPSAFYSDGRQQESSTSGSLRLVIPDLQPYISPGSQSSQLRVVIPDFPEGESSLDYSLSSEQNESKNAPFEEHIGLMTIPPPTPYSNEPAGLKNPEKWVLGDDAANSKNLKSKEYITRVSKVKVTGRVHSQPKANPETV